MEKTENQSFRINYLSIVDLKSRLGSLRRALISRNEERGIKENDGGAVNSTMIYYENFCKCHNVLPLQQ
jgi:hypothetical protein